MKKLLIGTTNQAKINTYRGLLKEFNFELITPDKLNIEAPEEIGNSLEEIVVKKAKYYFEKSGIPSLADDGGFEIDALHGEPGILSHRWLGRDASDQELVSEVINRMKDVPEGSRQCTFKVAIAVATPFGIMTSHGEVKGVVPFEPATKIVPGYPYDAVNYLPNYGKFVSELSDDEQEILNHRKHAVDKIRDIFEELSGA